PASAGPYEDGPDADDWRAPASYGPGGGSGAYGSSRPGPYASHEPEPTTPLPTIPAIRREKD
ncbi:hypothetical protein G3I42_02335, partial [Streptomyces sp. SID11385]|nr:hypothetical protein [Streptomyces sp. SID11385]